MAERKRSRRPGRPRTGTKWDEVEWVESRTEWHRAKGNKHDPVAKACADYVARFYPSDKQTAEDIDAFRKHIKNAQDEWRRI